MSRFAAVLFVCLLGIAGQAAAKETWTLQRAVMVMRHGVRPPTKAQVLPEGVTNRAWPDWDVPFGNLTTHGAQAIARLGEFDRSAYAGLIGDGCPDVHTVRIVADTDQRTLKTAEAWASTALPGCAPDIEHVPLDQADPRFSPFEQDKLPDAAPMLASAEAALPTGGMAAVDAANHDRLARLSTLLGCTGEAACNLADMSTHLDAAKGRVKIDGGIDIGSTAGEVLMLEYADGKPLDQVGWGLAERDTIRDLLNLHALEFQLVARPKAIAAFAAAPLLAEIRRGLFATDTARLTVLVGHDSNLAYLGGALGLHWTGGDFAPDDIPPGGALVFEKWRSTAGREVVIVRFRSQTLDEIRNLTPLGEGASAALPQPGCGGRTACTAGRFSAVLDQAAH